MDNRKIDALIAEHIMKMVVKYCTDEQDYFRKTEYDWSLVPHYSTEIFASTEVTIEAFRNCSWNIMRSGDGYMCGVESEGILYRVEASTSSLAICLAALRAALGDKFEEMLRQVA